MHLFCLLSTLVMGLLDYLTGYEASFSVFYLAPVSISAWYLHTGSAYLYCLLGAAVWNGANVLAGETFHHPIIYVWNAIVRLFFFWTTAALLQRLRSLLDRERDLSRRDYRTGLLNARAFHEALRAEHSRSARKSRPLGLAFIDLDHFKQVNDEMGHDEGDRVLVEVARTLESHLRASDIIARLGGDEFAVILPECPLEDAEQVGTKLVTCLRELSRKEGWPVTASVGVVVQTEPTTDDDLKEFLKSSDTLMYKVKEQGRDSFLVASYPSAS